MMILGDLPAGEKLTIGELAEAINASDNHVAKVVAKLVDMGLVTSVRGRNGGVHLAQHARRESVGKILRELEGPGEVVACEGNKTCPLVSRDCALRHRLASAKEAFFRELDADTVGDLIAATRTDGVAIGMPSVRTSSPDPRITS